MHSDNGNPELPRQLRNYLASEILLGQSKSSDRILMRCDVGLALGYEKTTFGRVSEIDNLLIDYSIRVSHLSRSVNCTPLKHRYCGAQPWHSGT
jgi:hypothetical protein